MKGMMLNPPHPLTVPATEFYSRHGLKQPMAKTRNEEQRDLFRGALEMMILRSLHRQPMHGYALVQHIRQRSNDLLQVEEGLLYPALQRMLRAKLLTAKWTMSQQPPRAHLPDHSGGNAASGAGSVEFRADAEGYLPGALPGGGIGGSNDFFPADLPAEPDPRRSGCGDSAAPGRGSRIAHGRRHEPQRCGVRGAAEIRQRNPHRRTGKRGIEDAEPLLVTASAVAIRAMERAMHVALGFNPHGVMVAQGDLNMAGYWFQSLRKTPRES
jgi:hypothetical protein